MPENLVVEIGLALLTLVGTLVAVIFQRQDKANADLSAAHQKLIDELFALHRADEKELVNFRLLLSDNYHKAPVVDDKINKLERSITEGFRQLGERFDHRFDILAKALSDHVLSDDRRKSDLQ